jgi:hypothetical protein
MSNTDLISGKTIEKAIYLIRGEKVMLDRDLAELYQVQTKALNQAVRRNLDRFPADFMFQLAEKEVAELNRSQFVTGSEKHRDPRFRPYAFTEQGVAMISSVLRSKRAITVNIEIMQAFDIAANRDAALARGSHNNARCFALVQPTAYFFRQRLILGEQFLELHSQRCP